MENCTFCKIINKQLKGYIIDENDKVISFLSLENHPLIVPKVHVPNIYALDEENGKAIMSEIIRIANAVKKGLACDGIYITQANEPAAGQDVFHIHFHIYPRWDNTKINEKTMQKEELMQKIKTHIVNT